MSAARVLDAIREEVSLIDPLHSDNPGKLAHIVRKPKGWKGRKVNPQAMVLEARINGTPLKALCGYVWVPTQNPESLPVCQKCKAIYEARLKPGQDKSTPSA